MNNYNSRKQPVKLKTKWDDICAILNKHGSEILYFGVKPNGDFLSALHFDTFILIFILTIKYYLLPPLAIFLGYHCLNHAVNINIIIGSMELIIPT